MCNNNNLVEVQHCLRGIKGVASLIGKSGDRDIAEALNILVCAADEALGVIAEVNQNTSTINNIKKGNP